MTQFIGFAGKKQTGKSTSAETLKTLLEQQGFKVTITAFADPLKRMCIEILGLKPEGVYGTNEQKNSLSHIKWDGLPIHIRTKYSKNTPSIWQRIFNPYTLYVKPRSGFMTNREVLQIMGTEIFRTLYNDVWAEAPFNQKWEHDYVILEDVRFSNEVQAIEKRNGTVIRLERLTGLKDDHESETALDNYPFNYKYINNDALDSLEQFLRKFTE